MSVWLKFSRLTLLTCFLWLIKLYSQHTAHEAQAGPSTFKLTRLIENCPFSHENSRFKHCSCCSLTRFANCCACGNKATTSICISIAERECVLSPYFNHFCSNCTDYKDFTNDDINDNPAKNIRERELKGDDIVDDRLENDNDDDGEDSKSVSLLNELEASPLYTEAGDPIPNISYLTESSDDDIDISGIHDAQAMFDDYDLQEFEKDREKDERIAESNFIDGLLFESTDSSD